MVEIAEIVDRESFEEWFSNADLPVSSQLALAHRSSMRVLPNYLSDNYLQKTGPLSEVKLLAVLRANLAALLVSDEREVLNLENILEKADLATIGLDINLSGSHAAEAATRSVSAALAKDPALQVKKSVAASGRSAFAGQNEPVFWAALRVDWIGSYRSSGLLRRRLWPENLKAEVPESEEFLKRFAPIHDGTWPFWLDWYQRALDGTEDRWDLLRDIALLDKDEDGNDLWQNPEKLATEIARLEAEYEAKHKAYPAERLLAENLLRAALADFQFDTARRLMAMQPFADDLAVLQDAERRDAFLDAAEEMRDDIERLAEGLKREGGAMQGSGLVSVELEALLEEFSKARQLQSLNVGKVIKFGEFLQSAVLDEPTRAEFGLLATKRLEQIVDGVLDLVRRYFSQSLLRFAPLEELELEPETSAWEYLNELRHALSDIRDTPTPGNLTPLAPEDIAVLGTIADEIERVMHAEAAAEGPAKSSLQRDINYKLALLTVSISLYATRAREVESDVGPVIDTLNKQVERGTGMYAFWQIIKRTIGWE